METKPDDSVRNSVVAIGRTVTFYRSAEDITSSIGLKGTVIGIANGTFVVKMHMPENHPAKNLYDKQFICTVAGNNCFYQFETYFIARSDAHQNVWSANLPSVFTRCQNRDHVRVQASDLKLRVKYPRDNGSFTDYHEAEILDISGGGLGFIADRRIPLEKKILLDLSGLPGFPEALVVFGIVRRCQEIQNGNDKATYRIGLDISSALTSKQHDLLVRDISKIQRIFLQKGVGMK